MKKELREIEEKYKALKDAKKSASASKYLSTQIERAARRLARGEISKKEFQEFVNGIEEIRAKYRQRPGGGGGSLPYEKVNGIDKDGVYIVRNGEILYLPLERETENGKATLKWFYKTLKPKEEKVEAKEAKAEA